jgi:hypothetical protein
MKRFWSLDAVVSIVEPLPMMDRETTKLKSSKADTL